MRGCVVVSMILVASTGCTASGGELGGLTFGTGTLPGADSDSGTDTEDLPQVSAGDDSVGSTGDDPTSASASGDDSSTGPVDPTDPSGGGTGGSGECTPGQTESCYGGAVGTEGVGPCQAGTRTCGDDETWGSCLGAALPSAEVCDNGLDEDCNGSADDGCQTASSCDPMAPSAGCGAGQHCFPSTSGATSCLGPTGLGTQYDTCSTDDDCAADHVCIDTGLGTLYCMQWCIGTLDCPSLFDSCTPLTPAVYAGAVEHGVCYDGLG
jgi:hypothetical protein